MNEKELSVINKVQSMMNEETPISKDELLVEISELGWKPATLNFALAKLKKAGAIKENENKEFIKIKDFDQSNITKKVRKVYKTRKSNYRKEIKELTPEQEELKSLILDNKEFLNGKVVHWEDKNGMVFPLEIAGGGDITLRCRFYLAGFMDSEKETGALVYIPWDDTAITQITDEINSHLEKTEKSHICVNFGAVPAK